MSQADDDLRCWYDPKTDTLHIEDATERDGSEKIKFNVYTVRDTIKWDWKVFWKTLENNQKVMNERKKWKK